MEKKNCGICKRNLVENKKIYKVILGLKKYDKELTYSEYFDEELKIAIAVEACKKCNKTIDNYINLKNEFRKNNEII